MPVDNTSAPPRCPDPLIVVVEGCLKHDPHARPKAGDILDVVQPMHNFAVGSRVRVVKLEREKNASGVGYKPKGKLATTSQYHKTAVVLSTDWYGVKFLSNLFR